MNIIETNQLSRRFGRTEAVHDLTFSVPEGSVTALLGPNGAGKTTTIKLLMNLLAPSGGEARVLGVDSHRLGEREFAQIGYVSENQKLPVWMTVRQLLDYCRPFYPTWDQKLETDLLSRFDLPAEATLGQLSRGMRMKASLLSSLAYRPRLLVLDEPFSGLDALVREDVMRGLLEAAELGNWTALIASHDLEEVERLADNIAFLEDARLRLYETKDGLLRRFRRVEVVGRSEQEIGSAAITDWLDWQAESNRVSFVDSNYRDAETEQLWRKRFPGAEVQARPMTLREIFITQTRVNNQPTKGVVR